MSQLLNGMGVVDGSICLAKTYTFYTYDRANDITGETTYTGYTGTCVIPYKSDNELYQAEIYDEATCLSITGETMSNWTINYLNALVTTGYTGYTTDGMTNIEDRVIYNAIDDNYYKLEHIENSNKCSGETIEQWAIIDNVTKGLWSPTDSIDYFYEELDNCGNKTCRRIVVLMNINPFSTTYCQVKYVERPLIVLIAPIVLTNSAVVTSPSTGVTFTGEIVSNVNGTILDRGFCYGIYSNPTVDDLTVSGTTGTIFTSETVGNLILNETYYVRAYVRYFNDSIACSTESIEYGTEISFIT